MGEWVGDPMLGPVGSIAEGGTNLLSENYYEPLNGHWNATLCVEVNWNVHLMFFYMGTWHASEVSALGPTNRMTIIFGAVPI